MGVSNSQLFFFVGLALRVVLFALDVPEWHHLTYQKELVTPITSYPRIQEGLFLFKLKESPYNGDLFHQGPLVLVLYWLFDLVSRPNKMILYGIYLFGDALLGIFLQKICASLTGNKFLGELTAAIYILNPFSILSCLSLSSILWNNLAIVAAIYFASIGSVVSAFFLAVATYLSFYPVILFPALLLMFENARLTSPKFAKGSFILSTFVQFFMGYFVFSLILGGASSFLHHSFFFEDDIWIFTWRWIDETYGQILAVRDLTPNIGLFWYFFTEVFDHFRNFYLFAYQYHIFLYVIPMRIALCHKPEFLTWSTLALLAIFKSYPSVGDILLQVSLIPLVFSDLAKTSQTYLTGVIFLFSAVLAPLFWVLWVYQGSGNANFYYAISLVVNVGQILFLTDAIDSVLTLDYWMKKDKKMKQKVE